MERDSRNNGEQSSRWLAVAMKRLSTNRIVVRMCQSCVGVAPPLMLNSL